MPISDSNNIDDETRRLVLTTGEILDLKFEMENQSVRIYVRNEEVGCISLRHYEITDFGRATTEVCRLTHAFLEGSRGRYKRHGVGTEAVRFYIQATDCRLELPDDDGIKKDDGSYLVQDGPAFVASLKEKLKQGKL